MPNSDQFSCFAYITCPSCHIRREVGQTKFKPGTTVKCPQPDCQAEFVFVPKIYFSKHTYPDISPDAFTHPLDRNALFTLHKIPGLDWAIRKMIALGYEKAFRINAIADYVKVTPRSAGYIHDMVVQASKCLEIELPDVYISQDPNPNAYTMGTEFPMVIIQSGLIELLSEDELYAALAHEIGHIKCHHVLYTMLSRFIRQALWHLGLPGQALMAINLALSEWYRKTELSADCAALLVTLL